MNQGQVIQSPNDKNKYFTSTLPNGLKYIVISDPNADTSAASLNISIGSLYDPLEYLGLAHFLEHSILLGTEKYPNKNEFPDFLAKNNGTSNAYTTTDNTNFHFDVSNEEFTKALDMFSQFFISPVFSSDLIERELEAVESEFKMTFRDEDERLINLIKSEGDKTSPFNKFLCGNMSTLNKSDIRERVIEFYKKHYTPAKMALSVLSNICIEELNELVIKLFSNIHSNNTECNTAVEFNWKYLYPDNSMGYLYKVIPIQSKHMLEFLWVINENENLNYKEQPCLYLQLILSHKGKNSLSSLLKKKEYIFTLTSSFTVEGDTYTSIYLSLKLTEKGFDNYKEVINIVFGFIEKLKSMDPSEQFFNELKQCAELQFRFFEKEDPIDYCIDLAENLSQFPAHKAISVSYLYEIYSPSLIKKTIQSLTTSNLNLYLLAKEFESLQSEGVQFSKEEWYQSLFIKEKIDYSSYAFTLSKEDDELLGYPIANIFIPKNFDIIDYSKHNIDLNQYKYPQKIADNTHLVYYKPDTEFKVPKCHFGSYVYVSNLNMDLNLYSAFSNIWTYIIKEELREEVFMAELASNFITIEFFNNALLICINGFSDSIESFVRTMMNKIKMILALKNIERLQSKVLAKLADYIKQIQNRKLDSADIQARDKLISFLKKPSIDNDKLLLIYENITKNINDKGIESIGLLDFITHFFKKTKFEWLVQGNILPTKALEIISFVEDSLIPINVNKTTLLSNEIRMFQLVNIDPKTTCYYQFTSEDKENENNCLLSYIQFGNFEHDLKTKTILRILLEILEEDFFYELRTEQKLGYYVTLESYKLYKVIGLICFVQSSTTHPEDIFNKVNDFFNDYDLNDEEEFTDEEYGKYAASVVTKLKEKYLNLNEEFDTNFSKMTGRSYHFSLREDMIDLIEKEITKKDVINFFNKYIYQSTKRLDVEVIGKNHLTSTPMEIEKDDELESIVSRVKVNDKNEFQEKNKFYDKLFY